MAFTAYAPPNVYTQTLTQSSNSVSLSGLRIPILIGVGQEELNQYNLEMIRGSKSDIDQQVVAELVSERFVVNNINPANPILGPVDGVTGRFRVRNYPIVTGEGYGATLKTPSPDSISVTVNGVSVAVGAVDGALGYVTLQVPPQPGDVVKCTYFFRRTDTAFTDDVSSQVTPAPATLTTPAAAPFQFVSGTTDTFVLVVDGVETTLTLPEGSFTASALKTLFDSYQIPGLATSVFVDAEGLSHLSFIAARKVAVTTGAANGAFGFSPRQSTSRNASFRVFQRPIVDGSDGGVTTNDTSKVVVMVNGKQEIPTELDGTNGVVTLALPPSSGSTVTVAYYANTWQDTFDTLPNTYVTSVQNCGFSPGRADYIENQDFILDNPTVDTAVIHWGTSVKASAFYTTTGATPFGESQVIPTLVDNKLYLSEAERFIDTRVVPAVASSTVFILPEVPTTGNGRDTVLDTNVYKKAANGRMALPSDRTDLISVWAGHDLPDALSRSQLKVAAVDSETRQITLRDPVSPDFTVFATFNYSRIRDDQYYFKATVAGALGQGQYEVVSAVQGSKVYQVRFGTKTGLAEIVQWPRGVEQVTDALHTGAGTPVSETVTVTFGRTAASNAAFTNSSASPYNLYAGTSDMFRVSVNGTAFAVDLSTAAPAYLVGQRFAVNATDQVTVTAANNTLALTIDGAEINVTLTPGTMTVTALVAAINAAIDLVDATSTGGPNFTTTAPNSLVSFRRIGAAGGDHVLVVRGLTTPSAFPAGLDQTAYVMVRPGSAESLVGLKTFQRADATMTATNKPATLVGSAAGPYLIEAGVNNTLAFQLDGVDYVATLPVGTSVAASALVTAINALPGLAGVASVSASRLRLSSTTTGVNSRIVIQEGNANEVLGFSAQTTATRTLVNVSEIVNVINAFTGFAVAGVAYVNSIEGSDYLTIESLTTGATTSSVAFTSGSSSAFNVTTGLGITAGLSGDNGENATENFTVSSSHPQGSAGVGIPGQTYTDARTGLRFSVLQSAVGSYTDGGRFTMSVSEAWMVNPSVPYNLPGSEVIVTDTVGVAVGDEALVRTFNPGGAEPAIGDSYFVSYKYEKQDWSTKLYTKFASVEANLGPISSENRTTLGARMAMDNGAVVLGIQQVAKAEGSNEASDIAYVNALDALKKPLRGNIKPDLIIPLNTSTNTYGALMQHCETMSTTSNASERMGFIGFAMGTQPSTVKTIARGLSSNRIVAVYPDSIVVTLTDALNNNVEVQVDGSFMAAALGGQAVNPVYDVATPYTRRALKSITRIPRILDGVEANQVAISGVTVVEDLSPVVRVRHGLTTRMENALSRLPTVTQIADYVQQASRATLDQYIGSKFLAGRANDVVRDLNSMFQQLIDAEIVAAKMGVMAAPDPNEVSSLTAEATYQPVFPLDYIHLTFNLRTSI